MKTQDKTPNTNRRELLKVSGVGVLSGVVAQALTPTPASGKIDPLPLPITPIEQKISYASWIHGHSMEIEYEDRILTQRRIGSMYRIVGKSGLANWFHFAIPTPVIIDDVRLKLDSIMLDFVTGSVDAVIDSVHVYDGSTRIGTWNDLGLSEEHHFERFVLEEPHSVSRGIGVSIGIGVGVEMMDHTMEFISAGGDFVV